MTSDETCTTRRTRVPSSDGELLAVVSDGSPAALWRCSTTVTSTGSRSGWVVGAGTHHPPLVVRDTGTVEPVGKLGTAMGLVPAVDLDDVRVVLEPGDLVCPFTDGLVEVRGSGFHVRRRGGWRRPRGPAPRSRHHATRHRAGRKATLPGWMPLPTAWVLDHRPTCSSATHPKTSFRRLKPLV